MKASSSSSESARRRAMAAVGVTLVVWALAVLPHHGEFWPFSIYPMFARAGRPWTNALMLEVSGPQDPGPWRLDRLPGRVYPTTLAGVSAMDLSQLVKLTSEWTDERVRLLRKLFAPALAEGRTLMLVRADGHWVHEAEVELTGIVVLGPEHTELLTRPRAQR